ncbi:MAG: hypothetical protein HS116_21100 [Planctomycetes bacterium]|nr:hypothetical protein [Planctomycetota bacterium]
MSRPRTTDLRYCAACKSTQKHTVKGDEFTCLQCGLIQRPKRRTAATQRH